MSLVTPFRVFISLLIIGTFALAAVQFTNQIKLHQKTPNSQQRKLCLAAASMTVVMCVGYSVFFVTYLYFLSTGMSSKKQDPRKWPLLYAVIYGNYLVVAYSGFVLIVLASLHRYHRLCSVAKGSTHEKVFVVAKYGSICSSIIAIITNVINVLIVENVLLTVTQTIAIGWMVSVDFYANYSMISKRLDISSLSRNPSGDESEQQRHHREKRRRLKTKLLTLFGITLLINMANLTSYTLTQILVTPMFSEMSMVSACGATLYVIVNLYLLDVLRDGIIEKKDRLTQLSSVNPFSQDHVYEENIGFQGNRDN